MKKLLFLLIMIVTLFSYTLVNAEEIPSEEQAILTYLQENYDFKSSNFVVLKSSSKYTSVVVNNVNSYFWSDNYLYIGIDTNYLPFNYSVLYFDLEGNFTSFKEQNVKVNTISQYISSMSSLGSILYSNVDIYKDQQKTDIKFEKNYIKNEDIEPEPSPSPEPSPEPSDKPEVDISELEKCNSFVCDISDSILGGFNDEQFPFVKIIVKFLLLLLMIFIFISPFWLLYKIWRWIF